MSIGYVTLLLDDEAKAWLRGESVAFPEAATSRWPTAAELRSALDSLNGYDVFYADNSESGWDATIVAQAPVHDGGSATIWTRRVSEDEQPLQFSFHKSSLGLALLILERLSHVCGPFLLVDDSNVIPAIVTPGADILGLAARYG